MPQRAISRSPMLRFRPLVESARSDAGLRFRLILCIVGAILLLLLLIIGEIGRLVANESNTTRTRFDVIVVLGTPTDSDGLPTPRQQARVREAVHEYELGAAPVILFTGGDTHKGHVEADTMGEIARSLGIPSSQILLERRAMNTIENACYSVQMMQAHKWHSAEIISSEEQQPRAGLIFGRFPVEYVTHASPSTEQPPAVGDKVDSVREMLKTSRFLLFGKLLERCLP